MTVFRWDSHPTSIMIDLSPPYPAQCMLKMALASCNPEQDEDYVAEPTTHIIFRDHLHTWQPWLSSFTKKVNLIFFFFELPQTGLQKNICFCLRQTRSSFQPAIFVWPLFSRPQSFQIHHHPLTNVFLIESDISVWAVGQGLWRVVLQ